MLLYSSVVLVMTVYVFNHVSLDLSQGVAVSTYIFVVFFVLSVVFRMCFENVCL